MTRYTPERDRHTVTSALEVLAARDRFVELLEQGPTWKPELEDELGVSRSTVYKAVCELEDHGLVQRTDDGYVLSTVGRLLVEERRRFLDDAESIYRPATLLSELPSGLDPPPELLTEGEAVPSERFAPNRPVSVVESLVGEAGSLKGVSPVVLPQYVEAFHEALVANGLDAELLLERPVLEHLSGEYERLFEEAKREGDLVVHTTDQILPYGLILVEEPTPRVALIVYDREGDLRGLVTSESPAVLEWARDEWQQHLAGVPDGGVDVDVAVG